MSLTIDDLCEAVKNRDIPVITNCLNEGVDVNTQDSDGYYPIEWLSKTEEDSDESSEAKSQSQEIESENKALEVLNILLPHNPNFFLKKEKGSYVLDDLLKKQWHRVFEKIVNHLNIDSDLTEIVLGGDEDSEESGPLLPFWSSSSDSEDDLDGLPLFFYIIMHGQKEDIQTFINCIRQKNIDIRTFLEKKYKNQDALIFSIEHRRFAIMGLLLELGANPGAVDGNNVSAFQLLVHKNNLPAVEIFLRFNPDVDHVDSFGQNCLHQIASVGAHEVMNVVLPRMSKQMYNHRSQLGKTPLFIAVQRIIEIEMEFFGDDYPKISSDGDEWIGDNAYRQATPFFYIIRILLLHWVDPSVGGSNDQSVVGLAHTIKAFGNYRKYLLKQYNYFKSREEVLGVLKDEESQDFRQAFENYMDMKLRQLIYSKPDVNNTRRELNKCLAKIEAAKFIEGKFISIYETCKSLITSKRNFELYITPRNSDDVVCEPYEDYFYTFLDGKLYQLTKIPDEPLYYLMTTLVYEAMRHDWDSPICKLHHNLIAKIAPQYKNFTLNQFKREIEKIETKEKNFFGENISDDSDSEKEDGYQAIPQRQKHLRFSYAQTLFKRAQPDKLFPVETSNDETRQLLVKGMPRYEAAKRQEIVREELDLDKKRDLERLNTLALRNELDVETIGTITTKFLVAQYRGITYRLDEWNKPSRKQHREAREERFPLFSRAVIEKAGYATYGEFFARREIDKVAVVNVAEKLHDQLLKLTLSGPIKVKLIGADEYLYDNALRALQDLYTKDYDKFHQFLDAISDRFLDEQIQVDKLEDAIALSIGAYNPFVSTADTPDHALRYAYGEKFYKGHQEKRLRPRWRRDGRAERPYSGKVYISLHEPLELLNKAHHVISLDNQGALHIGVLTSPEKETSFFAYIPEDRVVSQHIAKFPSFRGEYKEIYLEKYGLTKELYNKFKQAITRYAPHSPKAKHYKDLLAEHLISYQEVCLVEEAKIAAENQGAVLIYRNEFGGFSLFPPKGSDASATASKKRKSSALEAKDVLMSKRADRKDAEVPALSFLPSLVSRFSIFSYKQPNESLVKSLQTLLDFSDDEIVQLNNLRLANSDDDDEFIRLVVAQFSLTIFIHDAQVEQGVKRISAEGSEIEINLYYMGGGQYAALQPKEAVPNPLPPESQDDDNDALQLDF